MVKRLQGVSRGWSWLRGARVAGLSAAAGLLFLWLGGGFEEAYGLGTLFRLRGPVSAPPGIVIAAMDRASAESLGLPSPPWPRTIHADLIRTLDHHAPAAIVFDVYFTAERSALEDEELTAALRVSGNVVLQQGLERRTAAARAPGNDEARPEGSYDQTVDPIPPLRDSALAIAPFVVPADSPLLTSFWTFLSGTDVPTLPSVAFQLSASDLADDWTRILTTAGVEGQDPDAWKDRRVVKSMAELRQQIRMNAGLGNLAARAIAELQPDKARRLSALLDLYTGEDGRQLNFFGPVGTVTTVPYASILEGEAGIPDIRGKIVLVGVSEREVVSTVDTYETFFSNRSGIDLSGVEVLATGLANLMDRSSLRSSSIINTLIIVAVAVVLGIAAASASDLILGVASIALLLMVPIAAYALFVSVNFVMPLFTPLAIQLPVGILTIGLSLKSAERRMRHAVESAAHQFLPREVVERLAMGPLSSSVLPASKIASAIFLSTDVKGFTTLAERHSPERLDELAKDYFGPLFEAVARHRGEMLNMTADSMMCAWYLGQDPVRARCNAIAAALEMGALVGDFAARHPDSPMPTRFGLREGTAAFGVVGSSGRYVPTVVGDVTNTASRIDSLNKLLNTTVLASSEVLSKVEGLIVRPLGTFAPLGKLESINLVEILGNRDEDRQLCAMAEAFASCLAAFDAERWGDAAKLLGALHERYPDDGPTSFFLDLAGKYVENPPAVGTARPIRVNIK